MYFFAGYFSQAQGYVRSRPASRGWCLIPRLLPQEQALSQVVCSHGIGYRGQHRRIHSCGALLALSNFN